VWGDEMPLYQTHVPHPAVLPTSTPLYEEVEAEEVSLPELVWFQRHGNLRDYHADEETEARKHQRVSKSPLHLSAHHHTTPTSPQHHGQVATALMVGLGQEWVTLWLISASKKGKDLKICPNISYSKAQQVIYIMTNYK
jgi:hypothetical protein